MTLRERLEPVRVRADPAPARPTTLPSLTGLRWLAAALVFLCHVTVVEYFRGSPQHALTAVFGVGSTGVSLFFVLSGFVLAWSHDDATSARRFYLRRFARVWPAHLVFVAVSVTLCAVLVTMRHPGQNPVSDMANVLLVSTWIPAWSQAGNPVAWSLVCEVFFYAMFPLLWRLWSRARASSLIVAAVAGYAAVWVMPLILPAVHLAPSTTAASYHPLARWPEFALGVIAAIAVRRGIFRGVRLRTAALVVGLSYATAAVLGCSRSTAVGVTVLGFVLLVTALARADLGDVRTGLGGRIAVHLGAVSYSFYLVHLLVLGALAAGWAGGHPRLSVPAASALALAALVVSLLAAELTHRWVERPARRFLLAQLGARSDTRGTQPCPRPGAAGGTV